MNPHDLTLADIAREEGWLLVDYDGSGLYQIQKFDAAGTFATDVLAVAHVTWYAHRGSRFHALALEAHNRDAKAIEDLKRGLTHIKDQFGNHIATSRPASFAHLHAVLAGEYGGPHWFRLADGDLIIGVYPQFETYRQFEQEYP